MNERCLQRHLITDGLYGFSWFQLYRQNFSLLLNRLLNQFIGHHYEDLSSHNGNTSKKLTQNCKKLLDPRRQQKKRAFFFPQNKPATSTLVRQYKAMKAVQSSISSVLRASGQALDALGRKLEVAPYVDRCKSADISHPLTVHFLC
ncbi:hypothetical protein EON65_24840 [archaeon]|nr:MAG: hypothetical protein EON65_24840 [archaeon]